MTPEPGEISPSPPAEPWVPPQPTEPVGSPVPGTHHTVPISVPPPEARPARPALLADWDTGLGSLFPDPSGPPAPLPRRSSRRPRKPPRHPAIALPAAIVLALLAAFFAWQAAEPWWLALGRGADGTATVTRCDPRNGTVSADPHAATYRCVAFQAADGGFEAVDVTLLGAGSADPPEGTSLPARMISAGHDRAYAASTAGLHLRWSIGLLLVLACGAGIAWVTGATRLDERRSRRRAVLLSFAGPLVLAAGFLTTAAL